LKMSRLINLYKFLVPPPNLYILSTLIHFLTSICVTGFQNVSFDNFTNKGTSRCVYIRNDSAFKYEMALVHQ
jgi:hypothetical protein